MMTVCQICGDKGYSKLLIRCVQCRNIYVHRYCVLNPLFCEDEKLNWSCEFCDPCTTEPTAAVPKPDRKKTKKKSIPPQSKKPNVPEKETAKEAEATNLSILDQKNATESVKSKQAEPKETGIPVLPHVSDSTEVVASEEGDNHSEDLCPHVSDATEVIATDTANRVNPNKDVDGCEQDLSQSSKRPRRSVDAKKGKKNKDVVPDTSLKKEYYDVENVKQHKIKNANSSDATGSQQLRLQQDSETTEVVPSTDVEKGDDSNNDVNECVHKLQLKLSADTMKEKGKKIKDSICSIGVKTRSSDAVQVKKQNIKKVDSLSKKTDNFDKLGSGANKLSKLSSESDELEELPTNKNQPQDGELNDHDNAVVLSNRDVSERKTPRKKRKVVIEVEYSDEDQVFVLSKHPQFVGNVRKDSLSNSGSEAISKLSDDGVAQLSSIESIPHQSSPVNVDNCVRTREPSVVFENDIPGQPAPLNMVSYVPAQPLVDVAWRGYCNVADEFPPMSLVLEGHFSNKAHEKVQGAVSVLPEVLNFVFEPKLYAWPKTYERSPPTADGIGLYFFPVDERAEKLYFYLVDKMASCDLVLKSVINNLELLVFCSVELPREEWRFRRRYYLWGVFRPRKDLIMPNLPPNVYNINNVQVPELSNTHFHQETNGHHHDAEFLDHRGSSDRWDRRSRRLKGRDCNSGRSQRSYRSKDSVVII